jgi:prepilin-type N-terminal cleavage/methylation domain-containing protein
MSIEGGKILCELPTATALAPLQMATKRQGFTLIEILIVMVILGAVAAVAIPHYAGAKNKAYTAAMLADLRTVAIYEEQFAMDNHGQYFGGLATSENPLNGFTPSKGVTVTLTAFNILGSQLADWSAVARHAQSSQNCEMRTGVITCTTGNSLATGILPD